jgi:pilus assembly protein CpaD
MGQRHIFFPKRRRWGRRLVALGLLSAVAFAVTACNGYKTPDEKRAPEIALGQFKEQRVMRRHQVAFAADSAKLERNEARGIDSFIDRVAPKVGDAVVVIASGPGAKARQQAVVARLQALGLKPFVAPGAEGDKATTTILVERHIYIAKSCMGEPIAHTPTADLALPPGCATDRNLAQMVANPADLTRGRGVDSFEAGPAAAAVQRYRDGKVTPLEPSSVTSSSQLNVGQ